MSIVSRPHILHFEDYKAYLRAMIDYVQMQKGCSIRNLHRKAGLKSSNYVQMILSGKRNLGASAAKGLAKALSLSEQETEYFLLMVAVVSAPSYIAKKRAKANLQAFRAFHSPRELKYPRDFFSRWYTPVIFEALGTEWSRKTLSEMARSLDISEVEVKEALQVLTRCGLIEFRSNRWIKKVAVVEIPDGDRSLIQLAYHSLVLKHVRRLLLSSPNPIDVGTMTLLLSASSLRQLRQKIKEIEDLGRCGYSSHGDVVSIYQFNFQLVPSLPIESVASATEDRLLKDK